MRPLLQDCLHALNQIPNQTIDRDWKHPTTYALAGALSAALAKSSGTNLHLEIGWHGMCRERPDLDDSDMVHAERKDEIESVDVMLILVLPDTGEVVPLIEKDHLSKVEADELFAQLSGLFPDADQSTSPE